MVITLHTAAPTAGEWSGVAEQARGILGPLLDLAAPAVFAALLVLLVVRALLRSSRYRALGVLGERDLAAVRREVAEAERKTVGEILPVVVERSDPHPGAEWLAALSTWIVGSTLLAAWLPWHRPALLLACQLALGTVGFLLARALPDFKRTFVFEDRATAVAQEQAFQEFYANGLQRTAAATGVLLFVSLLERRVVVLADEGIDAKVDRAFWEDTDEVILEGIRRGSLRDGLVAGIRRAGDLLARQFPWREGDRDEIPDRVVVRRE